MQKMTARTALLAAGASIALSGLVAAPAAFAEDTATDTSPRTEMRQLAGLHDAVIKNVSKKQDLVVCRNWGHHTCVSGAGILKPGQNTKDRFGWSDADGDWVPPRCEDVILGKSGGDAGLWNKVLGFFGRTVPVDIHCSR